MIDNLFIWAVFVVAFWLGMAGGWTLHQGIAESATPDRHRED